jgi:hypothetical protein
VGFPCWKRDDKHSGCLLLSCWSIVWYSWCIRKVVFMDMAGQKGQWSRHIGQLSEPPYLGTLALRATTRKSADFASDLYT